MNHRPATSRRFAAFTLVEVLATLVLVAIILPVAMRGISLALATTDHAKHLTEASALAESTLAELITTGGWQGTNLSGDGGETWPGYQWSADVEDWEDETMRQLTVRVQWTARGHEREISLTTLVPAGSE